MALSFENVRAQIRWLSGRLLAGATTGTLASYHRSEDDQLAAPDAIGLATVNRTGQAFAPQWALRTHRLGGLDLVRELCEEQLGVVLPAGQVDAFVLDPGNRGRVEHRGHLLEGRKYRSGVRQKGRGSRRGNPRPRVGCCIG